MFNSAFWYEKTKYFKNSIDDNWENIEIDDDDKSGGFLYCSCGSEMELTLPGVVYDFGAACNIYRSRINSHVIIFGIVQLVEMQHIVIHVVVMIIVINVVEKKLNNS